MQKKCVAVHRLISTPSIVCGIIAAIFWIVVRILSGSPYDLLHKIDGIELFPPIWLYSLCCFIWSYLLGSSVGIINETIICKKGIDYERNAYRGGIKFLLSFFLFLSYYPLMFAREAIFISVICVLLSAVSSCACSYFWLKISGIASLIMGGFALWELYVFIISFSVFLSR